MSDPGVVSPVLGSPEYDAAMVAKFDAANAVPTPEVEATPAAPARPDHIPEKFWDADKGEVRTEALLKSYSELEKARAVKGTPPVVEPTVAPVVDPNAPPVVSPAAVEAQAAVTAVGLDYAAMSSEFAEQGELSEETYKALDAKGIPQEMVDSYIAGQQALAAQWDNAGYEVAGGKEEFQKMATWAAGALTRQESVAFNTAFNDPNVDAMKMAVSALKSKYEGANGKAPGLLGGTPNGGDQGYQSRAQMTTDMKDPRYSKDPAFRASVERKLASTTAF